MGTVELVGEGFHLANTIIDKYIEDPARRARARREYIDTLENLRAKIKEEKDHEKMDTLLLELIAAVHDR